MGWKQASRTGIYLPTYWRTARNWKKGPSLPSASASSSFSWCDVFFSLKQIPLAFRKMKWNEIGSPSWTDVNLNFFFFFFPFTKSCEYPSQWTPMRHPHSFIHTYSFHYMRVVIRLFIHPPSTDWLNTKFSIFFILYRLFLLLLLLFLCIFILCFITFMRGAGRVGSSSSRRRTQEQKIRNAKEKNRNNI